MKRFVPFFSLALLSWGGLWAQTSVSINGQDRLPFDATGGIYFHNDTMTLVHLSGTESYALDQVESLVFDFQTQAIESVCEESEMVLFPMPARNSITLRGIGLEPQQAAIYNMQGAVVRQQKVSEGALLDISALAAGEYILRCGQKVVKFNKL